MRFSFHIDVGSTWFLCGVTFFYLTVAYHSTGFHNPDEHFQLIEFASYKLGWASRGELAWEFNEQIRSGLQPAICYLVFKLLVLIGVSDVYFLALALRVLTALLAVAVIRYFIKCTIDQIKPKNRTTFILLSYLLWFLPYINIRFSSETWSGLFFLLSLAVLSSPAGKNRGRYFLLGALFGLSILFRFQSALLVLGAGLWLLLVAKSKFSMIFVAACSCSLVLLVGVFIDRWLYGQFTFTLYNYFHVNIVQDVASQYGVSPWHAIFRYIIEAPGPWGFFLFFTFCWLLLKQPTHIILWVCIPFLLVHAIIPHKEIRFLFPLANLCPLLLLLGYQHLSTVGSIDRLKPVALALLVFLAVTNICGLVVISTVGAGNTKASITQYINKNYREDQPNVLFIEGSNPYSDWPFPINTFYREPKVSLTELVTVWQRNLLEKKKERRVNLLLLPNSEITGPKTIAYLEALGLVKVYQSIPWISQQIIKFYDDSINDHNFQLYEFRE